MRLTSSERLRSFIGSGGRMSGRTLARCAGVHPSFINHLTAGRRRSCEPQTAQRIAEALGVPLDVLFDPEMSTVTHDADNRHAA